ncbi:helix-turn-helix domain-containing protein [Ktedonobacter racemifer]|uniref:Transcriptional regulator, XRE family n=1 Tax=Ktedonobacter racemifer DSM 44963 TaxID=485913 RepID=D6TWY5_KTERA|nr:helix-turn-helix domain-containing protein [Ktedonobacter racemifer]EFH84718.1 transcriptional regulator, XRE family [Ktedonobacter racemifer DSM 44963]
MTTRRIPNVLLKQAREEKGWTQRRLALELDVDEKTVQSWERGTRFPSLEYRKQLSDLLGKPLEQLGLLPLEKQKQPASQEMLSAPSTGDLSFTLQKVQLSSMLLEKGDFLSSSKRQLISRNDVNRQRMLTRVFNFWISGVLAHSLYQHNLLPLALQEQPDVLVNPWQDTVRESMLPAKPLPEGTHITHMYEEADGELLILGEPGAGKTTLLLELTNHLLQQARQDALSPLPIVFNLSSWGKKRTSLHVWLLDELHTKYQVPHQVARRWIEDEQLALLLDGLDEMQATHRLACIEAINQYRQVHGLVPVVVCSRTAEYLNQPVRLVLNKAISIQPLSAQQVNKYVERGGEALIALKVAMQRDPGLQELAENPLMLTTLAMTYHGESAAEQILPDSSVLIHYLVFETYVKRVLQRRGSKGQYTPQQTKRYLTWLAKQMQEHAMTEFYLERLQPDWLPPSLLQNYRLLIIRVVFGLEIFVNSSVLGMFRGDSLPDQPGLFSWLGGGHGNTLLDWMAPGLGGGIRGVTSLMIAVGFVMILVVLLVQRRTIPTLSKALVIRGLRSATRSALAVGSVVGVFSGCILGFSGGIGYGLYRGVGTGLFAGLLISMMRILMTLLRSEAETQQSKSYSFSLSTRLVNIVCFSICGACGFGSIYAWQFGHINHFVVIYALIIGFFFGIVAGAANGIDIIPGLGVSIKPAEIVKWEAPWSQTGNLIRQGSLLGGVILGGVVLMLTSISSSFYGWHYGVQFGLIYGVIVGCIGSIAAMFTGFFSAGWLSELIDDQRQFVKPNEGIRRSIRHALFAGGIFGSVGGLTGGVICSMAFGLAGIPGWPILGAGFAIAIGIVFAHKFFAFYGGIAWLEHYVLRALLWLKGEIPWNYVAFLDYAAERILLRKVAGGYMFFHRLLLDYFASAHTDTPLSEHLL